VLKGDIDSMGIIFSLFDAPAAIYAECAPMRHGDLARTFGLHLNLLGLLSSPWARTGS
jgi:hypothetical protein